jgi:hypothetical protein
MKLLSHGFDMYFGRRLFLYTVEYSNVSQTQLPGAIELGRNIFRLRVGNVGSCVS